MKIVQRDNARITDTIGRDYEEASKLRALLRKLKVGEMVELEIRNIAHAHRIRAMIYTFQKQTNRLLTARLNAKKHVGFVLLKG